MLSRGVRKKTTSKINFLIIYSPNYVKNIVVNKGVCSTEIEQFYKSYIKSKKSLLPFVTCKMALSKDFFTPLPKNLFGSLYL